MSLGGKTWTFFEHMEDPSRSFWESQGVRISAAGLLHQAFSELTAMQEIARDAAAARAAIRAGTGTAVGLTAAADDVLARLAERPH